MLNRKSSIIAAIDISSSKIICLVAKINDSKQCNVIGISHKISTGINAGIISDIELVKKNIEEAVYEAEYKAKERISKYYFSLSVNSVMSRIVSSNISITGNEITMKDLHKILFDVIDQYKRNNLEIIHYFPYQYILDGNGGIKNPLGMYGEDLTCNMNVISITSSHLLNFMKCIENFANESSANYIVNTYAAGISSLADDELQNGVTFIEFGSCTTSISIFIYDTLIYSDAIAIGGSHITADIARCLCIDLLSAERIKNLYGAVIATESDENEIITISLSNDHEVINIGRKLLIDIIKARIEEVVEMIMAKIEESDVEPVRRVVIGGGGARLPGLKDFISYKLNTRVRLASSIKAIEGMGESTLEFATAVGMLIYGAKNHKSSNRQQSKESLVAKIWRAITNQFSI